MYVRSMMCVDGGVGGGGAAASSYCFNSKMQHGEECETV